MKSAISQPRDKNTNLLNEKLSSKKAEQMVKPSIKHENKHKEKCLSQQNCRKKQSDCQTTEKWLEDEGFQIKKTEHHCKEYKFIAQKTNERCSSRYVFEVKDYGRAISKLKLLIL